MDRMSNYMPNVGDRVRATLGENVLVGDVRNVDPDYTDITFNGGRYWTTVWHSDGWQFEKVVEVPTKFGAVIRRADGQKFTRNRQGGTDYWYCWEEGWVPEDEATSGGFTVLFDGVDE